MFMTNKCLLNLESYKIFNKSKKVSRTIDDLTYTRIQNIHQSTNKCFEVV